MSTLRTDTLSNAAGSKSVPVNTVVDGSAKAWVNFDGTGTPAIRAAFNVTSITDNNAGDYTLNFTNALPDANYAAVGLSRAQATGLVTAVVVEEHFDTAPTASAFRLNVKQGSARADVTDCHVVVFR